MKTLDDILTRLENDVERDTYKRFTQHISGKSPKQSHEEAKARIKILMLELLGEEEDELNPAAIVQRAPMSRNELRADLCQKIKAL